MIFFADGNMGQISLQHRLNSTFWAFQARISPTNRGTVDATIRNTRND